MSLLYRSGQLAQRSKGQDPGILPARREARREMAMSMAGRGWRAILEALERCLPPWMAWPRASNGWLWCV